MLINPNTLTDSELFDLFERMEDRNTVDSLFLRHLEKNREQYRNEFDAGIAAIESSRAEFVQMSREQKIEFFCNVHGIGAFQKRVSIKKALNMFP